MGRRHRIKEEKTEAMDGIGVRGENLHGWSGKDRRI